MYLITKRETCQEKHKILVRNLNDLIEVCGVLKNLEKKKGHNVEELWIKYYENERELQYIITEVEE